MNSKAVAVPAGKDRFDENTQMVFGVFPLATKVSSKDTDGAVYIFEHAEMPKGGPPRHYHHHQDEWFYIVKGEFAFEVGDEKYRMGPGDSLLAPRKIAHVWANAGDTPGTLLIALNPAGTFEAFMHEATKLASPPSPEAAQQLFSAHGMEVVGPPLFVD
ncbi:MAG: cupin domain-containing protein [Candidatus Hydrogenedentes bacterium]|nr:cupin domain-containing protein [Candidatus Hydrogenedentota bacterium]